MSTPHKHRPRKAWLFAAFADADDPIGINKDIADLRRLFEDDLAPEHRATVEVVRSDAGTLTTDVITDALDAIAGFAGDRLIWVGAHGRRRGLGTPFLHTDDRDGGHVTIEALWRRLGQIAHEGDGLMLAVLDVCHAAPPAASPLIGQLESSLVGIAATQADQKARGSAAEGGWLTQRFIRALIAPRNPPADGLVTVGSLIDAIARDRVAEDHGGQTPFLVGQKAYTATVLNRLEARVAPEPTPLAAWRAHTLRRHTRLGMLFEADGEKARVYVELALARDDRTKGRDVAARRASRLTLRRLMAHRPDAGPARWRVLGEPGAGKSTIARHLAAELAAAAGGPIVVYLALAGLARSGVHPFDAAEAELARAEGQSAAAGLGAALHAAAVEGGVWLLLDGLDEVEADAAPALRADLLSWGASLAEVPIAVLGRPFDERPLPGFEHARVLPLDPAQQRALLTRWLGDTRAGLLGARITMGPRLRELARNPLMLSLMALLTDAGEAVGDSRKALYDKAIEILLEQPQRYGKAVALTDPPAARAVLGAVSVALHSRGGEAWPPAVIRSEVKTAVRSGALDADDLAGCGGASRLLAELPRCGGVLGPFGGAEGEWRYLHRSLREFLAAEHLAERPSRLQGVLNELQQSETPDHWGVVLGLSCALADAPLDTLKLVQAASPGLALWALPEVELAPAAGLAFFDRLVGESDPAQHGEDLRRLAVSWGPKPAAAEALLAGVAPETPVERLAVVHYALCVAGVAVDDAAFFRRAGRPMPAPAALVRIEGDSFVMGSPEGEHGRDQNEVQHRVTVSFFELGATAVTRAEYAAFDPAHQCPGGETHPVSGLSWYAARLYAAWRGAALPTEAEWEFACRAGTTTGFWSGDGEDALARVGWYDENSGQEVRPVGQKPANPLGLYDMHGNVDEWCADWFGPYEPADTQGPTGPPHGVNRVIRGGVAWDDAQHCRSACRYCWSPGYRDDHLGFRLARRPPST